MTLQEISALLQSRTDRSEPTFVRISTPLKDEGLWFGEVVWMHHDGNIIEASITSSTQEKLLEELTYHVRRYVELPVL